MIKTQTKKKSKNERKKNHYIITNGIAFKEKKNEKKNNKEGM